MTENDVLNCKLNLGTEFKTRINKDGKQEIIRIIKESPFKARRFLHTSQLVPKIIDYWEIKTDEKEYNFRPFSATTILAS